jgi:hypothetical protein
MWATDVPASELHKQGLQRPRMAAPEGLRVLRQFCETGTGPSPDHTKDADLFAKELLYYRVLDVFAQVYGRGGEASLREKFPLALLSNLVCYNTSVAQPTLLITSFRAIRTLVTGPM